MTAPVLTPALALAYLREVSIDVRGAAVLDAGGELLAGDPALLATARELLADAREGAVERVRSRAEGTAAAVRAPDGRAIAVVAGPRALVPLLLHDLRVTLADLTAAER